MKNNVTLICLFSLFISNGLYAQIESNFTGFKETNVQVPSLSINTILADEIPYLRLNAALLSPNTSSINTSNAALTTTFLKPPPTYKLIEPADTFSQKRFWTLMGTWATSYTATVLVLNNVWYAQYPRSRFHFFDDQREWLEIDKAGHVLTAYTQSKWAANALFGRA